MTTKPCPVCATPNSLRMTEVMKADDIGTYSVAGAQMKFTASPHIEISCDNCEWLAYGKIRDGYVEVDCE